MNHWEYIVWFALFAWLPTAILWIFYWPLYRKYKKVFIYCIAGAIIFGYPWDYWATHYWLWHFSGDHTLGIFLGGLPVEEYIFFASEALLYSSIALALRKHLNKPS